MSQWPDEFHDPALRSAIQRAEGKPAAPSSLRNKVAAMLAADVAAESASRPHNSPSDRSGNRWRLPTTPRLSLRTAALAAVVLIAVGLAAVQIRDFVGESSPRIAVVARVPISTSLMASMVRSHNDFAKLPDHHVLPGDDLKVLQTQLSSGAGVTAFSAPLGNGWKFSGASISSVGTTKAAELLFSRGDETASIFSMTEAGGNCGSNECFLQMVDHSAVAAASREGSLYGVVVSQSSAGDPPLDDAQTILKTVETTMFGSTQSCAIQLPALGATPAASPPATRQ